MTDFDDDYPPKEISFLRQQQLFFKRAITHFTNPDLFLYTGQTRDQIPDDVLHVRVDPSVRVIDWDTFAGCKQMVTIELHDDIIRIMGRAFIDCYALKPPKIPPSVKEIGDLAFSTCLALDSLDLPEGLERIGRAAFPSCSFRNVRIPRSMTEVGEKAFSCCTDLVSIEIPYGVTAINDETFFQCLELRNVAIPSTVNKVGLNAFECCFRLQEKFPDDDDLVAALKTRFDDLPIHKICYYQAHESTETTLEELVEANRKEEEFAEEANAVVRKRQDAFGMTPLHILALSKKQDLEVYQALVEHHPGDLMLEDGWGYLPVYYACLSEASVEIVQYLLATHKSTFADTKIYWQNIVDSFSIMFVSATVLRYVIHWSIEDRLATVDYEKWRVDILSEIELIPDGGRRTWKEKEINIANVYGKLAKYELKEVTSLLEMAAWKSKLSQSESVVREDKEKDGESDAVEAMEGEEDDHAEGKVVITADDEFRKNCRINSGAELIISNVLPFL
jgi:hypothetical protein